MAMDETLLMQLSAYADGEADAATTRAIEERLAKEPELQRALARLLALDVAAQQEKIPVPKAIANDAAIVRSARSVPTSVEKKLEETARAMPVPAVSDEKFGAAWMAIARRMEHDRVTKDVMALDDGECEVPQTVSPEFNVARRTWQILDKAAQRIEAPVMNADRSAETWQAIARETVAVPEQNGAWVGVLDAAARAIVVPQPAEARYSAVWKNIAATFTKNAGAEVVAADRVPTVSDEKWNAVWSEVKRQTTGVQKSVIPVDFTPAPKKSNWIWGAVASVAMAAMVAVVAIVFAPGNTSEPVAMVVPEVADDRYELDLLYLPDQTQPVVTMFLKDDSPKNFRWMPE